VRRVRREGSKPHWEVTRRYGAEPVINSESGMKIWKCQCCGKDAADQRRLEPTSVIHTILSMLAGRRLSIVWQ
jgi:hypothetical protein